MSYKVDIFGVSVDSITVDALHIQIRQLIESKAHALVLNVNVYALNLAYKSNWLKDFLNSAEIVFCDGAGVMLAGRILGGHIPERITYADWMWQLSEFAEENDFSIFLLGGKPGVSEEAAQKLKARYPKLRIVGLHHGYFNKSLGSHENQSVIEYINELSPDILLVSFGMPLQEYWLMENWSSINAQVALTGGATLDYVSGQLQRAPKWMTDNGFEWLGRLIIEPRRLWQRYLIGNPLFLARVVKQKLGK